MQTPNYLITIPPAQDPRDRQPAGYEPIAVEPTSVVYDPDATEFAGDDPMERRQALIEYAVKSGTHLWIVTASYALDDAALDQIDGRTDPDTTADMFHADRFVGFEVVCPVCLSPYSQRARRRRCKGGRA